MKPWHLTTFLATLLLTLLLPGCKEVINPHSTPAGDPSRLVASIAANTSQASKTSSQGQIVLTLNNAPEANEPLEQDFITEVVELFEKRNPNIRIQYSPWQYTPDSFFERLNNRTLTDIIEVDAEQMAPIIQANAAADLTEDVKLTPEMRTMNPNVFRVTSHNGRTYGVPTELHTLALFYNRSLLESTRIVVPRPSEDAPKGKGADSDPRDYALANMPTLPEESPVQVAQYQGAPYYYPPGYQAPQRSSGRDQQQRQQPQQGRSSGRSNRRQQQDDYQRQYEQYQQQYQEYQRQYQQYYQQRYPGQQPPPAPGAEEDARARRVKSRKDRSRDGETTPTETTDSGDGKTSTTPDDILTSEAEMALQEEQTSASDSVTSVIQTADLPTDNEQFIRLAVRLTDHKKGIAGYGPVLFASEGGREYTQWAVQAGIPMQRITNPETVNPGQKPIELSVDKSGDVAQFLKDLHWRFDVTPMPNKCYYDNLMTMFVEGKLGMMVMPADGPTIAELLRRGMSLNDIGITALPKGAVNRDHLTYGKCLIVNTQLDKVHRTAAFKWLMFMASPEVHRLRAQFFHRERELTAAPCVPLYSPQMQQEHYEAIKNYRSLPLWLDYESNIANNLHLEPAYQTDRFYEAIALGLRDIIERQDSNPYQAVKLMASGFENKYIIGEKPADFLDALVQYIKKARAN